MADLPDFNEEPTFEQPVEAPTYSTGDADRGFTASGGPPSDLPDFNAPSGYEPPAPASSELPDFNASNPQPVAPRPQAGGDADAGYSATGSTPDQEVSPVQQEYENYAKDQGYGSDEESFNSFLETRGVPRSPEALQNAYDTYVGDRQEDLREPFQNELKDKYSAALAEFNAGRDKALEDFKASRPPEEQEARQPEHPWAGQRAVDSLGTAGQRLMQGDLLGAAGATVGAAASALSVPREIVSSGLGYSAGAVTQAAEDLGVPQGDLLNSVAKNPLVSPSLAALASLDPKAREAGVQAAENWRNEPGLLLRSQEQLDAMPGIARGTLSLGSAIAMDPLTYLGPVAAGLKAVGKVAPKVAEVAESAGPVENFIRPTENLVDDLIHASGPNVLAQTATAAGKVAVPASDLSDRLAPLIANNPNALVTVANKLGDAFEGFNNLMAKPAQGLEKLTGTQASTAAFVFGSLVPSNVAVDPLMDQYASGLKKDLRSNLGDDGYAFLMQMSQGVLAGVLGGLAWRYGLTSEGALGRVLPRTAGISVSDIVNQKGQVVRTLKPNEHIESTYKPSGEVDRTYVLNEKGRTTYTLKDGQRPAIGETAQYRRGLVGGDGGAFLRTSHQERAIQSMEGFGVALRDMVDGDPDKLVDTVTALATVKREDLLSETKLLETAKAAGADLAREGTFGPNTRSVVGLLRNALSDIGPNPGKAATADEIKTWLTNLKKENGGDPEAIVGELYKLVSMRVTKDLNLGDVRLTNPVMRYQMILGELKLRPELQEKILSGAKNETERLKLASYLDPANKTYKEVHSTLGRRGSFAEQQNLFYDLNSLNKTLERAANAAGVNTKALYAFDPALRSPKTNLAMQIMGGSKSLISPFWLMSRPQYHFNNVLGNAASILMSQGIHGLAWVLTHNPEAAVDARGGLGEWANRPGWTKGSIPEELKPNRQPGYLDVLETSLPRGLSQAIRGTRGGVNAPGRGLSKFVEKGLDAMPFFTESFWRSRSYALAYVKNFDAGFKTEATRFLMSKAGLDAKTAANYARWYSNEILNGGTKHWSSHMDFSVFGPEAGEAYRKAALTMSPKQFIEYMQSTWDSVAARAEGAGKGFDVGRYSRGRFRDESLAAGYSAAETDAALLLADARAEQWAREAPDRTPEDYYAERFVAVKKGTTEDLRNEINSLHQNLKPDLPDTGLSGFYSKLNVAAESLPRRASAEQMLNTLKGAGVKADELFWTGTDEWLNSRRGQMVSKDELLDHIVNNSVQIKEVVKQEGTANPPKWADYQGERVVTPGGTNQREVLLTIPEKVSDTDLVRVVPVESSDGSPLGYRVAEYGPNGDFRGYVSGVTKDLETANESRANYIREQFPDLAQGPAPYKSPHWNEPNVISHIRMNDRVGPNGERILHVEEVQSDLNQAGRKNGYAGGKPITEGDLKVEQVNNRYSGIPQWRITEPNGNFYDINANNVSRESAIAQTLDHINQQGHKPPLLPFNKTWDELSMKRVIQMAVEEGYDKISWTKGEEQSRRYPGDEGRDLGMQGFYDKKLANIANQIGKKFGARVEEGRINTAVRPTRGDTHVDIRIPGEGKFYQRIEWGKDYDGLTARQGPTGKWYIADKNGEPIALATDLAEAQKKIDAIQKFVNEPLPTDPSWTLPITPEMKKSVSTEGLPLFQKNNPKDAVLGTTSFLSDGRVIIRLFQDADASTLPHELMHVFRRDLPEGQQLLLKQFAGIPNRPTWTRDAEEKVARGFEQYLRTGKTPNPELTDVFTQYKGWLEQLYTRADQLQALTPEAIGVFDRMLGLPPDLDKYATKLLPPGVLRDAYVNEGNVPSIGFIQSRLKVDAKIAQQIAERLKTGPKLVFNEVTPKSTPVEPPVDATAPEAPPVVPEVSPEVPPVTPPERAEANKKATLAGSNRFRDIVNGLVKPDFSNVGTLAQTRGREPWQMTREEYLRSVSHGTEKVDVHIEDSVSDPSTLENLVESGEIKDGLYDASDGFVYRVSNGAIDIVPGLRSDVDPRTGDITVTRKEAPTNIYETPIFHRTDEPIGLGDLRPGKEYGRSGENRYNAVYFSTDPNGPFGKNLIEARLKPGAKVVQADQAPRTTEEALRQGIDAIITYAGRDGEHPDIAVLNPGALRAGAYDESVQNARASGKQPATLEQTRRPGAAADKTALDAQLAGYKGYLDLYNGALTEAEHRVRIKDPNADDYVLRAIDIAKRVEENRQRVLKDFPPAISDAEVATISKQLGIEDINAPIPSAQETLRTIGERHITNATDQIKNLPSSSTIIPNLFDPKELKSIQKLVAAQARQAALEKTQATMFSYSVDRTFADYLLDHVMPYHYWYTRHSAQAARFMAHNPALYATTLMALKKMHQEDANDGSFAMRFETPFTLPGSTGAKTYFNPAALSPFVTQSLFQAADPDAPKKDRNVYEVVKDLFGVSLHWPIEFVIQRLGTLGIDSPFVQHYTDKTTGERKILPGEMRAQDLVAWDTLIRQVSGGSIDIEKPLRQWVYGTGEKYSDDRATVLELFRQATLGSTPAERERLTDEAKLALLSRLEGKPNDLWNQAKSNALHEAAGYTGFRAVAPFVGSLTSFQTQQSVAAGALNKEYQSIKKVDDPFDLNSKKVTSKQFFTDHPEITATWAQRDKNGNPVEPQYLRASIALDDIYDASAEIAQKYAYQLKELSDQFEAGKITGAVWSTKQSQINYNKKAEQDASEKALLEKYGITRDQLPKFDPTPKSAVEKAVAAFFDIETPKNKDGEPDYKARTAAQNEFLESLPQAIRTDVLAEIRKNETPAAKYFREEIQPILDKLGSIPKYTGTYSDKDRERWDAAAAAYGKVYGETKNHAQAIAAVKAIGLTEADYTEYRNRKNDKYGEYRDSAEAAKYRAFYDFKESTKPATTPRTNSAAGASTSRREVAGLRNGETPISTTEYFAKYDELQKAGKSAEAGLLRAQNWDTLIAAGYRLNGEKPSIREAQLKVDREKLYDQMPPKGPARDLWLAQGNAKKLNEIATGLGQKATWREDTLDQAKARIQIDQIYDQANRLSSADRSRYLAANRDTLNRLNEVVKGTASIPTSRPTYTPAPSRGGGGGGGGSRPAPSPRNVGLENFLKDAGGALVQRLRDYFDGKTALTPAELAILRRLRAKYPFGLGFDAPEMSWLHEIGSQIR